MLNEFSKQCKPMQNIYEVLDKIAKAKSIKIDNAPLDVLQDLNGLQKFLH